MKSKKNKNSLALAAYFGIGIGIIILISLVFKGIDLFRQSKFDSNHRLSVAIISSDESQVVSVNPKEGTMLKMDIKGSTDLVQLEDLGLPIDAYIIFSKDYKIEDSNPKSEFAKILFNIGKIKTNLSFIDLIRVTIFSGGLSSENIDEEEVRAGDTLRINNLSSTLFKDPTISSERLNIQITNTTQVAGLGNKLARYITNLGGVVILINSSPQVMESSKIIAPKESETVKRLSKVLEIPFEKGQAGALSDAIIILGEDKKDLFK